ncbi:MAG: ABC transporter substrate-binding protein [Clostridiales bacterium]|nr:ABC transporter substrate-binding protein [Clostridiales bacterium]
MKLKRAAAFVLAAMMAVSVSGCGGSSSSGSTEAAGGGSAAGTESQGAQASDKTAATEQVDKVVVGLTASSFDISPFGTQSVPRQWFTQNMYAALYCMPYFGASLDEMEPWMAKSIEKVDDTTYSVELYDYIHDSKGNAITSEDIVFSYEHLFTDAQETRIGTYLDNIEIVDDYNMLFHLKKHGPGVMEYLAGNYTMAICDKEWFESASDEERLNDPAVTGAYKVASYTAGAELVLEAVEDYWQTDESLRNHGDTQNVKTIDYKVITENSMRSIALENHEIDATVIDASELKRFYDGAAPLAGWNVSIDKGVFCNTIFINMDSGMSPLADDINLRKAVLTALDSESIMYGGDYDESTGEVCYSFGTSAMAGYKDEWVGGDYWTYDPAKAKEYYEASGYAPGDITLRLLSRTSIADGIHSVIIANLEAVGFKVELLSYDQALFNTYKVDSTQWDIILDNKGSTGHIATCWDNNFNPAGFSNGSVCFNHDDKLVELLTNVTTSGSEEDVQTFHEYLQEIACVKGLFTTYNLMVGQDGIMELAVNGNMMPRVNAFVFADDYVSVGN